MAANLTAAEVDRMSLEQLARGLAVQLEPHKVAKVALMMLTLVRDATAELSKVDPQMAKVHDICARALAAADGVAGPRLFVPGNGAA